jgi:hypothetical protein
MAMATDNRDDFAYLNDIALPALSIKISCQIQESISDG